MSLDRAALERDNAEFTEADSWPEPDERGEPIPIPDVTTVGLVMRRLSRLQAERTEVDDIADAEIDRQNRWRKDRQAGIDREIAWGRQAVEDFMRVNEVASGRRKLELSDGTGSLGRGRERCEVTDEAEFLAWAFGQFAPVRHEAAKFVRDNVAHPDLLRVTVEIHPDKDALKALERAPDVAQDRSVTPIVNARGVLVDGEAVPGVRVVREADLKFDLKLNDPI